MLGQIATGFYNSLANKQTDLYTSRIEICKKCSKMHRGVLGEMCGVCGCVLIAKCRVPGASCPENKW